MLCYFCSFGPVLLVVWHACVLRRLEDYEHTRRRENPGEGQKEERRRQGGQEKTGRRPGRGPSPPKLQDYFRGFGMFYSIVFHSILFDLNSATVYVFYSYLFCSNSSECIPFSFGAGLCLGIYLACTIGCTLLLDHFWLLRPPVPPVLLGCSWRTARARGETEPMRRAEGNREKARRRPPK